MPRQITEFKKFLDIANGNKSAKDAKTKAVKKTVFIKKSSSSRVTKFKIRRGKYLYTFKTQKDDLAKKLEDSFNGNQFEKVLIKNKVPSKKTQQK